MVRGLAQRGLQLVLIIVECLLAASVVLYAGCEAKRKTCCSFCCQLLSNAVSSDVKLVGPAVDRLEMLLETVAVGQLFPFVCWTTAHIRPRGIMHIFIKYGDRKSVV